jgi:hypothetical protein
MYAKNTDFRNEACRKPDLGPGLVQESMNLKNIFKVCFTVHFLALVLNNRMPDSFDVTETDVIVTSPLTELVLFFSSKIFEQFHSKQNKMCARLRNN